MCHICGFRSLTNRMCNWIKGYKQQYLNFFNCLTIMLIASKLINLNKKNLNSASFLWVWPSLYEISQQKCGVCPNPMRVIIIIIIISC